MSDNFLLYVAELAKQGNRAEALKLLKAYIQKHQQDEHGWYLLAHLVEDEDIKKRALERVLRINPNHERALIVLKALHASREAMSIVPSVSPEEVFTEATYVDEILPDPEPDFFEIGYSIPSQGSSVPNWLKSIFAGLGIIIFTFIIFAGLGYYAYRFQHLGILGLFGPDLSRVAETEDFSIHYPQNWQGFIYEDGFVAANTELSQLDAIDLSNFSAQNFFNEPPFSVDAYGDDGLQVLIMTPVTADVLSALQAQDSVAYTSADEYIRQSISSLERFDNGSSFVTALQEQQIGGEDGVLGSIEVNIDDSDLFFALYNASVRHNGQEYLFTYIAIGAEGENHERLIKRILRSVDFAK